MSPAAAMVTVLPVATGVGDGLGEAVGEGVGVGVGVGVDPTVGGSVGNGVSGRNVGKGVGSRKVGNGVGSSVGPGASGGGGPNVGGSVGPAVGTGWLVATPLVGVADAACLATPEGDPLGFGAEAEVPGVEIDDPTTIRPLGVSTTPRTDSTGVEPGDAEPRLDGDTTRLGVGPGVAHAQTAAATATAPAIAVSLRCWTRRRVGVMARWESSGLRPSSSGGGVWRLGRRAERQF